MNFSGSKPGDVKAAPDTFFRFVHPDDVERLRNEWEEATRSGKFDAEFRIVRADGRECWLAGKGSFIFDGHSDGHDTGTSGKPRRFMGVNFDITERKQAEETVAAAQRQVQSIIDNTTAIIYAFDLEERFLLANTALAELLNSTPEQMIGKRRHDFMPKQDADWHEANDRQVIEAGKALEFEEYSQLKDRSITWLTTKFPLRDAQGRIYAVAGISTDVTERKKVEEAVRASEVRFRGLFTAMDEGFILCEVLTDEGGRPADFRYLDVNPAGERFFGRPREEIVGRTYREIGGTKADAEWIAMLGNIALTGQPASLERYAPVGGHWVDLHAYSPRPGQFAAVFADITERKIADEALRASDEQFRVLIQNLQSAIALIDEHGSFRIVNNSFLRVFEIPQDATILNVNNRDWAQWQVFDEQGVLLEVDEHPVRKAALTRTAVKNQLVAVKSPSSPDLKWLLVSAEPILNKAGGIHRIVCTYYDITDRKRAETALKEQAKQLEDVNKDLESFSYSVSHDLRAPLRAIAGYSQMILKKEGSAFRRRNPTAFPDDHGQTQRRWVGSSMICLAFSRLGSQAVAKRSLNMEELIGEVWQELVTINPDREMTLKIGQMPAACGDRALIRQVYSNLLGNAVKFTQGRNPAVIEAGSCVQDGETVYYVRDNGVGFDMKFYDKLFGVFQRLHSEEEYKGTGIGLALVKRIINQARRPGLGGRGSGQGGDVLLHASDPARMMLSHSLTDTPFQPVIFAFHRIPRSLTRR